MSITSSIHVYDCHQVVDCHGRELSVEGGVVLIQRLQVLHGHVWSCVVVDG